VIRPVTSVDLPALLRVARTMHARSIYADTVPLDEAHTRALFGHFLQNQHRHGEPGATFLRLAAVEGYPTGVIVGTLGRVYHLGPPDRLRASDQFFYNDGDPRDSVRLLDAYLDWAGQQPGVIEIVSGATDAIMDHARIAKLYERRGFEPFGALYRKDLT
jgi:hypothetical protein